MFIEQDAHPDEPQQDQPHDEAGHHAGKIDPDVCYLAAAPRHEQLDGLIGQRREQAAQSRMPSGGVSRAADFLCPENSAVKNDTAGHLPCLVQRVK